MELLGELDHEEVVFAHDPESGLRAIIAIHSTRLGPSLGGTRFYPFPSEGDALADVLRLSRAMSYKSAAAGLDLGGGKAVVIGDPKTDKTPELFRAYGRAVDSLGGRYITTEDVGTTVADMEIIRTVTSHVTGTALGHGGSGDPSQATGLGVYAAMRTVAQRLWGDSSLEGKHVALQGVGKVASFLGEHLHEAGARMTVTDVSTDALDRFVAATGAAVVGVDEIASVECDIFSPCALGASLSETTIPLLRCVAVVGCANNQLATPEDGERLAARGILYAPDYIVNAGGVINIAHELKGYNQAEAFAHTERIAETIGRVFEIADAEGITTAVAADRLAQARLSSSTSRTWGGHAG